MIIIKVEECEKKRNVNTLTRVKFSIFSTTLVSMVPDDEVAVTVSFLSVTSALRIFRHVMQIPDGNQELTSASSKKERERAEKKILNFRRKRRSPQMSIYLSLLEETLQFSLI